jgi:hypothetical protein
LSARARQDGSAAAARRHCYDVWREYDPENTLRFYALRLYEAGFIQSSPNKIIAEHTDWRFLDELKARAEGVTARGIGSFLPAGAFASRPCVDGPFACPRSLRAPHRS